MTDAPVCVVGLGVIGGSLARALRRDDARPVTAYTASRDDALAAASAGIVAAPSLDAALDPVRAGGGVVVLAVPLDAIAAVAERVLAAAPDALVLHTGSLQRVDAVRLSTAARDRVFGTHPIAGTHGAGFAESRADLFQGAAVSLESRLGGSAREQAAALWRAAGATRLDVRDAEAHDALMAWVSHLPQLVATSVASVLAAHGTALDACGPGARDVTRLAGSPLSMWRPMLERAPADTLAALRSAREALGELERALADRDVAALAARWEQARAWRVPAERS